MRNAIPPTPRSLLAADKHFCFARRPARRETGQRTSFTAGGVVSRSLAGLRRRNSVATPERRSSPAGGLTLGGIIVIVGIVLIFLTEWWIGVLVALIGLVFFGGFARGRWY
jgi:hypothetical protein